LKLKRKFKLLDVGNMQNETFTINNFNLDFVGETLWYKRKKTAKENQSTQIKNLLIPVH